MTVLSGLFLSPWDKLSRTGSHICVILTVDFPGKGIFMEEAI